MGQQGWGVKQGGDNKTYTIIGDGSTKQFDIELPYSNTNILVNAWKEFNDYGLSPIDITRPTTLADNYIRVTFSNFAVPQVGENFKIVIKKV